MLDDLEGLWWVRGLRRTDTHSPCRSSLSLTLLPLSGSDIYKPYFHPRVICLSSHLLPAAVFSSRRSPALEGRRVKENKQRVPSNFPSNTARKKNNPRQTHSLAGSRTQRYRPSAAPHRFTYKYTTPRPTRPRRNATHKSTKPLSSRSKGEYFLLSLPLSLPYDSYP